MINNLGILRFDTAMLHKRSELVFDIFTNKSEEWKPNSEASEAFKRAYCHQIDSDHPPIHFMGLFDTVGALGVPTKLGEHSPYEFYNTAVSRSVRHVYQCAAIHDRLLFFQPCPITRDPKYDPSHPEYDPTKNLDGFHTEQIWTPGCHYDVGRQHFKFGIGFWTRLVAKMPWEYQIPEILPNHDYADYALNYIVTKMVNEGFPSLDNWPVLRAVEDQVNTTRWDGDVYDKLILEFNLFSFESWIIGERLLPRECIMVHFVDIDNEKYPSRAVQNHAFLYLNGPEPQQIDVNPLHLQQRIEDSPNIFDTIRGLLGSN